MAEKGRRLFVCSEGGALTPRGSLGEAGRWVLTEGRWRRRRHSSFHVPEIILFAAALPHCLNVDAWTSFESFNLYLILEGLRAEGRRDSEHGQELAGATRSQTLNLPRRPE